MDSLGFPWILSSETRLINGLRGFFAKQFFSPSLPLRRGTEPAVEAMLKGATVHGASLIYFLIFCNLLSSEPFFGCLHPKELTRGAPLSKFEGRHPEAAVEPHLGSSVLVHARRLEDRRHRVPRRERDSGGIGFGRVKEYGRARRASQQA